MIQTCQADLLGTTTDGFVISAITDCLGSQVVVRRNDRTCALSQPLNNHQAAVDEGKKALKEGAVVWNEWGGPVNSLLELAIAMREGHEKSN